MLSMEPFIVHHAERPGWIEVVCGSMFSGKTEELIRRLRRARIARQRVEIFKPALDTRFSATDVVSHDENAIPSTPVSAAEQILLLAADADVVGIDEAQFFSLDLVDVAGKLARSGKRVIVAGLDQDYLGRPFEPMPQLMAVAEIVTKLHAVCVVCGAAANHSQRVVASGARVLLGATDAYEPRCRAHFDPSDPHPTEGEPASHAGDDTVAPADRVPADRPVRVDPVSSPAPTDAAVTPPPMPLA